MKLWGQKYALAHLSWIRKNWTSAGWQKKGYKQRQDFSGHILHSLQIQWRMSGLLPAGTFFVFEGPRASLGAAVTRYPVTGDVEGSHLMLMLLSWTSVTCIWDGVSISGQQKSFFWVCWYRKPSPHCCVLAEFYSALLGRKNTCCYLFVSHASPEQKSLNHDVWVSDLISMLVEDLCCFKGY